MSRAALTTLLALSLTLMSAMLSASEIVFSRVKVNIDKGLYVLDADASVELNDTIEAGLASGVPLYFNTKVSIDRQRLFWFDSTVYEANRRFALVYYELTRHYRVSVVNENQARNFRSLLDALEYIGAIRDIELMSVDTLQQDKRYRGTIELSLDVNALPLPLRPLLFVSSDWRVRSVAHSWMIERG